MNAVEITAISGTVDLQGRSVGARATILAKNIMANRVVTVDPSMRVHDVAKIMSEHRADALLVVDGQIPVGIITESDLIRREELGTSPAHCVIDQTLPECVKSRGQCARDIMTPNPVVVTEDASLQDIVELMESKHIKHMPVVRDRKLVGVVNRSDIVRALAARPDEMHYPHLDDDDIIRFKVIETLMAIPGTSVWRTDVAVSKGMVKLLGFIEDENARDLSCRVIEQIPFVSAVDDHRAVLQPY